MPTKKRQPTKARTLAKSGPKKKGQAPARVLLKKDRNSIHLEFAHPRQVLPHLLSLASQIADKHFARANFTATVEDVLGTDAACQIVSGCADSDCWTCTLADLKLDSDLFQTCVFNGVQRKGYFIPRNQIPASQTTQLYTVVMAIQNAKRKENA